jgi:hypothetical protein
MVIAWKRKRIMERGSKNAGRGFQALLLFPLFWVLSVTQREKKAGGEAAWAGTGWREAEGWV